MYIKETILLRQVSTKLLLIYERPGNSKKIFLCSFNEVYKQNTVEKSTKVDQGFPKNYSSISVISDMKLRKLLDKIKTNLGKIDP